MWLKNNDGYFMAELLLSLAAWLVATSFLLPLTLFMVGQSIQVKQEAEATHLLYDRLMQLKFHPNSTVDGSIDKAGTNFQLTTTEAKSGKVEVCVEFDGYVNKKTSKCALAE